MNQKDNVLIEEAAATLHKRYKSLRHTAAAAAYLTDGTLLTAINSTHFSGFVCAEMALLDLAINSGLEVDTAVAVKFEDEDTKEQVCVINPCGKCRQILLEYAPKSKLLINGDHDELRKVLISELLPFAYVQTQTQRIWDEV